MNKIIYMHYTFTDILNYKYADHRCILDKLLVCLKVNAEVVLWS